MTLRSPMDSADLAGLKRHLVAEAVLDAALDAIVVINGTGSVIEWNPAASELFQWSREEALGRPLVELIMPEELREAHLVGFDHYLHTGEDPALNTRLTLPATRRDGTKITVELAISPSSGPDGPLFTGWLRDITELVEVRHALDRSEERLASLVVNISDVITIVKADGSWVSASGVTRLLGYEKGHEFEGSFLSILHPDDVDIAQQVFAEALSGVRHSDQHIDLRVRVPDGSWHILETVAENLVDDPAINGLVLTGRDVTHQRAKAAELRRTTSQLAALASSLTDGVLFVDDDQNIVFTNQAFCHLFNLDSQPDELVGRSTVSIRPNAVTLVHDPEQFVGVIAHRLNSAESATGDRIALRDGRTFERDYTPVEIGDEERCHLWLYRDISSRQALDHARQQLLEIERGLREQAEEQARSLREVSDLKSELVAMVSHELRTPLTSIVSLADLLLSDINAQAKTSNVDCDVEWPNSASGTREFIEVIARNAHRLVRLVDDLLLFGQPNSGVVSVDRSEIDLSTVVDRAVTSARRRAEEAGLGLEICIIPGPVCVADAGRIDQVVENLLSNAMKFTAAGGMIRVTAHHGDRSWVVSVSDNGVGIPADQQDHLFEPFFRASTTATTTEGTGLGLAISHAIIDLHGGTFGVESELGRGSRFTFTIPDESES